MKLSCLFGAHHRAARVWWDGFDFRSKCKHCGVPLYKYGNKRWRRLDPKREALFLRYQETQIEFAPDSRIGVAVAPSSGAPLPIGAPFE